jgi:hypothetical protein
MTWELFGKMISSARGDDGWEFQVVGSQQFEKRNLGKDSTRVKNHRMPREHGTIPRIHYSIHFRGRSQIGLYHPPTNDEPSSSLLCIFHSGGT